MDLISIRWISEVTNVFLFYMRFSKMNLTWTHKYATHPGKFKRIRVLSGPFGKSTFILITRDPSLLIPNPTCVRGTRRSFGPEPARVSGRVSGFRIQVDPWRPLVQTLAPDESLLRRLGSKWRHFLKMATAILRSFGFTFLQWKEAETRRPSFFTVYGLHTVDKTSVS